HEYARISLKYHVCSKCGKEKFVRFPGKDYNGKIIWKNLFKMDLLSILFLFSISFMIVSYIIDTANCREIMSEGCNYCERTNCCDYLYEQEGSKLNIELPDFNFNESTEGIT
ncbi:unnamed protein product, partial [marine sediment metagenome]